MTWFYLSFADDDGWLGGAFVEARTYKQAFIRSHKLGINPAQRGKECEVKLKPIPDEYMVTIPLENRHRLLGRDDFPDLVRWSEEFQELENARCFVCHKHDFWHAKQYGQFWCGNVICRLRLWWRFSESIWARLW